MADKALITEIDEFLEREGMPPTTFGLLALKDGKFVSNLRAGRRVWPETAEKVRTFMREYGRKDGEQPGDSAARASHTEAAE